MIFMKTNLNILVVLIIIHWVIPLLLCLTTIGAYVNVVYLPDRVRELINAYVSLKLIGNYLKINTDKKSNITKKR